MTLRERFAWSVTPSPASGALPREPAHNQDDIRNVIELMRLNYDRIVGANRKYVLMAPLPFTSISPRGSRRNVLFRRR